MIRFASVLVLLAGCSSSPEPVRQCRPIAPVNNETTVIIMQQSVTIGGETDATIVRATMQSEGLRWSVSRSEDGSFREGRIHASGACLSEMWMEKTDRRSVRD